MKSCTAHQAEEIRKNVQELKNYKDFILSTNQWLQKLDLALQSLKTSLGEHQADIGSKLKYQDISIEKMDEKNISHRKQMNDQLDAYREQMSFCLNFVKQKAAESDKRFEMLNEVSEEISHFKETLIIAFSDIDRLDQAIQTLATRLNNKVESSIEQVKKEIFNRPTELPTIKKSISEKFETFDVNFRGIVEEIEKLKKRIFVSSKYIEDLYDKVKVHTAAFERIK